MLRIKLIRSPIGYQKQTRANVEALGLRKVNAEVLKEDNACLRGQLHRVKELLIITDETTGDVIFDARNIRAKATRKDKKPSETH